MDQDVRLLTSKKDNIQGETADSLWNLLIKYYHVRIKFHTREFRAFMLNKARPRCSHLLEEKNLRGLVVRLEELDLLAKRLVEGEEGVSGLVVEKAYRLARESGIFIGGNLGLRCYVY